MAHPKKTHKHKPGGTGATLPPPENTQPIPTNGPQFGETIPTPDPTKFTIKHGNDNAAWNIIDHTKQYPRPFPVVEGTDEPVVKIADAFGDQGALPL